VQQSLQTPVRADTLGLNEGEVETTAFDVLTQYIEGKMQYIEGR